MSDPNAPGARIILGIDIAKAKFDLALLRGDRVKSKAFHNTPAGFEALRQWLATQGIALAQLHACMEATGQYFEPLAAFLHQAGVYVSVVNPALISSYAKAVNARQKTDKVDAQIIARFAARECPARWEPMAASVRTLRDLTRRLTNLQDLRRQELNRLESAGTAVAPSIDDLVKYIDQQIEQIRRKIEQHIKDDADMGGQATLLDSIPGVGSATISEVLAEVPPEVLKDVRKLDAFTGLCPAQHESGSSVKRRSSISKRGNARLRSKLYMPAIVAKQHNPVIKAFYERLLANGKTKKQAIVACMRKLLHLMVGVLKSKKPFDPNVNSAKTA